MCIYQALRGASPSQDSQYIVKKLSLKVKQFIFQLNFSVGKKLKEIYSLTVFSVGVINFAVAATQYNFFNEIDLKLNINFQLKSK